MKKVILGIDFGTSNSVVSFFNIDKNDIEIISSIPTVLFFDPTSETILFGHPAYSLLDTNEYSSNIIKNVKRSIGKECYFNILYNNNKCNFSVNDIVYIFIKHLVELANEKIDHTIYEIKSIVITVPAYFNDLQRELIKSICEKVLSNTNTYGIRILNEPTAAALAYSFLKNDIDEEHIIVFDSGAGTTDLSYLYMDYTEHIYEVKNVIGDNFLGGEDITNLLYDFVIKKFKINIEKLKPRQINKIYQTCEDVKRASSTSNSVQIVLELGDECYQYLLTRAQFVEITRPFFMKIRELIYSLITDIENSQKLIINKVIFIGGTSRIPYFQDLFKEIFGPGIQINNKIDPDLTVSIGASYQGHQICNDNDNDNDNDKDNFTLMDIVPLTLGIETLGGIMSPIISRNSMIPIIRKEVFTNSDDYEDTLVVNIYQGERRFVADNFLLTFFEIPLDKSSEYQKGDVLIEITFEINLNNIITAKASIDNTELIVHKISHNNDINKLNIQEILIDAEMNKLIDSEMANKVMYKLELYDSFKHLLSVFHDKKYLLENNDNDNNNSFILFQLNELFNETFNVITNYMKYSPSDLKKIKKNFEESWHTLLFTFDPIIKDSTGLIIDAIIGMDIKD